MKKLRAFVLATAVATVSVAGSAGQQLDDERAAVEAAEQWLSLLDEGLIADIHFGLMAGFQSHPKPSPTGREALEVALSTAASSCGEP